MEMLEVKCLLVLDSFYVTLKDIVVSFDEEDSKQKCENWTRKKMLNVSARRHPGSFLPPSSR